MVFIWPWGENRRTGPGNHVELNGQRAAAIVIGTYSGHQIRKRFSDCKVGTVTKKHMVCILEEPLAFPLYH